ncbi:MAG TPA: cysteine desulfurase family protein [Terriglobales bacterium]|nr:cysteine desulfurase family protein [Terriglobales bacterium]
MTCAYFDNNANAPVLPEVLQAMLPALSGAVGNASSIHQRGQAAKAALERARAQVATLIHAQPNEIVFTSGGTESNNLAIRGAVAEWMATRARDGVKPHLITTRIEHHAVLHVFEDLERQGHAVTYVAPDRNGRIEAAAVAAALRPDTALVSVMMANNETGVLQPVAEIAAITKAAGVAFHVDAIQAAGKVPVDALATGCQFLSLSAHKFHGPAGIGALYVRRGARLRPILLGGHHERDRRAGTENVPGIVGMGAAAELATDASACARIAALRDRLETGILALVEGSGVVGAGAARVPNTANIYFDGIEGEALLIALDLHGFCVSTGAACSSGAIEPSHVLLAMGFSKARARSCIRFSLGRQNSEAEVDALLRALPALVERQRRLAPATMVRSA